MKGSVKRQEGNFAISVLEPVKGRKMYDVNLDFDRSEAMIAALCKAGRGDKAIVQIQFHMNSWTAWMESEGDFPSSGDHYEVKDDLTYYTRGDFYGLQFLPKALLEEFKLDKIVTC